MRLRRACAGSRVFGGVAQKLVTPPLDTTVTVQIRGSVTNSIGMSLLPELLLTVLFGTQASFTHPGVILPQKESLGDSELKAIVKKSQRSREARYVEEQIHRMNYLSERILCRFASSTNFHEERLWATHHEYGRP